MKKTFFLVAFVFLCQVAFAQVKWGVYGGFSGLTAKDYTTKTAFVDQTDFIVAPSYNVGFFFEPNIYKNLFFETGIFVGQKGYGTDDYLELYEKSASFDFVMPYVGVPTLLNCYLVNKKFKLFISAGQKIGMCFDGKKRPSKNVYASYSGILEDGTHYSFNLHDLPTQKFDVGSDGAFRSFHYDLCLGGGIGIGRFYLMATYDWGMLNILNTDLFKYKSRVLNLSLRIDFSKKPKPTV